MPSTLMRDSIRSLVQITATKIWMSEDSSVQEPKPLQIITEAPMTQSPLKPLLPLTLL